MSWILGVVIWAFLLAAVGVYGQRNWHQDDETSWTWSAYVFGTLVLFLVVPVYVFMEFLHWLDG